MATPEPADGEVLVRVHASSVNAADWYGLNGRPYVARPLMGMRKPKSSALGSDFAGVVAAVGGGVDDFAPGDEVYGCDGGAFAEYVIAIDAVDRKPANMSFEEAAAVPLAALTALQGLRDHAGVKPGQRVARERRGRRCRHVRRAGREGARRRGACGVQRRQRRAGEGARRGSCLRLRQRGLHAQPASATTWCSTTPATARGVSMCRALDADRHGGARRGAAP